MSRKRQSIAPPAQPPAAHRGDEPWARLRSGTAHPFIYRRMIAAVDPQARPGDVVAVYDKHGEPFGRGFWHDRSQIALRMLTWDHTPIDEAFFRGRIERAVAWRERILEGHDTNACRLVHAEGDGLSGLIAERYDDVIVIEVFALAIFQRLEQIQRLLTETTGIARFAVRADERIQRLEGFEVSRAAGDDLPRTLTVRENGLRFRVDVRLGHKTGFFCDQRENRSRLAGLCRGADVLDVCCYTGGFGIYASKLGQAAEVTGVDLDEEAVAMAVKNANLNDTRIQHVHADAFSYLRQMHANGRTYDVVVLDPPKFVPSRDEHHAGSRKYVDLNALAMNVIKPGGVLLTCSCSGPVTRDDLLGMTKAAAHRTHRSLQIFETTGAAADHPIMANCPESGYLKAIWARVH